MDVREKLAELIAKAKAMYADDYTDHTEDEYIAETLLDNFVTVLDGKPLEAFLHPIDAYKGLKAKYLVFKADTGEKVDNCFILRPDKDHSAVEALRAYAKATDNEILAGDIFNWVGKGVTVHEWISVDDRLPEIPEGWEETPEPVLYMMKNTKTIYTGYYGEGGVWKDKYFRQYADSRNGVDADNVLCWMYQHDLPQPPKGE